MRLTIAAVGRLRDGPMLALYRDYAARLPWTVALKEVEERRKLPAPARVAAESRLLAAVIPAGALVVVLDQRGIALSSEDFAARFGQWQEQGVGDLAFVIGGADGLAPEWRRQAKLVLSLGAMTWPHLLVRVMLAEQLFRSHCILSGHPYHRG
jgi:23S rRNA (pseudouridine1915-N3)-methyltransferase